MDCEFFQSLYMPLRVTKDETGKNVIEKAVIIP